MQTHTNKHCTNKDTLLANITLASNPPSRTYRSHNLLNPSQHSNNTSQTVSPQSSDTSHTVSPQSSDTSHTVSPQSSHTSHTVSPQSSDTSHTVSPQSSDTSQPVYPQYNDTSQTACTESRYIKQAGRRNDVVDKRITSRNPERIRNPATKLCNALVEEADCCVTFVKILGHCPAHNETEIIEDPESKEDTPNEAIKPIKGNNLNSTGVIKNNTNVI